MKSRILATLFVLVFAGCDKPASQDDKHIAELEAQIKAMKDNGGSTAPSPPMDLDRETARKVLAPYFAARTVKSLTLKKATLRQAEEQGYLTKDGRDDIFYFAPKASSLARLWLKDYEIQTHMICENNEPYGDLTFKINTPLAETFSEITGIAPALGMGPDARQVEYVTHISFPDSIDSNIINFLYTGIRYKSIVLKYDNGWRVEKL